jgi:hypothetical protein
MRNNGLIRLILLKVELALMTKKKHVLLFILLEKSDGKQLAMTDIRLTTLINIVQQCFKYK